MFLILCFLNGLLIEMSAAVMYDGKFFDPKNKITAECVVKRMMSDYPYIGNLDKTVDGEACIPWNEVTESWFSSATNTLRQLKQPVESFHHSKCRTVKLRTGHPMLKVYPPQSPIPDPTVASGGWGPWCYIRKEGTDGVQKFNYTPSACFSVCDESKVVIGSQRKNKTDQSYTILKLNYNAQLLDSIDKFFLDYQFGDKKYYTYKKSQEQPPQYFELRQKVFIILSCIFIAVIVWIVTCFFLKKHSKKVHRKKRKALDDFYKNTSLADIKLQSELRREAEDE